MHQTRPHFSMSVRYYKWMFLLVIGFLPLVFIAAATGKIQIAPASWIIAAVWPFAAAIILWYVNRTCSSERIKYMDGLHYVTESMMTGWGFMSFFTVLPVLLIVFLIFRLVFALL